MAFFLSRVIEAGRIRSAVTASALVVVLLAAATLYLPGLNSGLALDDFYNLHLLEDIDARGYAGYVFSGVAGPGGRPLSLLTFALQHESWPGSPAAFKALNLGIHLLNGLLVFLVARLLLHHADLRPRAAVAVAAAAAGLWLIHPVHVNTVLYIVQRMAQLSTLFVLLGLLGWLAARERWSATRPRLALWGMSVALAGGTLLAVLCKENGILLPLLVLIADATLLRNAPRPVGYGTWRGWFLVLPSVLLFGWLLWQLPDVIRSFDSRPYTMWQKLLTEFRVLIDYLRVLLLPSPGAFGLYHDDYPVAAGPWSPPSIPAAVAGVVFLVAAALVLRRRRPLLAFGILWFFAAHLLESTHLNLALYFEHRNYLPSVGVFLLLAAGAQRLAAQVSRPLLLLLPAAIYVVLTAWITVQNTTLWRQPLQMAVAAVRNHPDSPAANAAVANRMLAEGYVGNVLALLGELEERFPGALYPRIKHLAVTGCVRDAAVDEAWWRETMAHAGRARPAGFEHAGELDQLLGALAAGDCPGVDPGRLLALMEIMAANPRFSRERGALLELAARLSLYGNDAARASRHLRAAVGVSPTVNRRLQLIDILLATGETAEAAAQLALLEQRLGRRPFGEAGYAARLEQIRAAIRAQGNQEP